MARPEGDELGRVGGSVAGILREAKVGAIMIATDAGHGLWPALLATGRDHGWQATPCPTKRVLCGPKTCCFLEKKQRGNRREAAAPGGTAAMPAATAAFCSG